MTTSQLLKAKVKAPKPFVTYFFIIVNIFIYSLTCVHENGFSFDKLIFGPGLKELIYFGAKVNGLIATGEVHRLLFPIFLHVNFIHLLINMLALFYIGIILEKKIGHYYTFLLYLICGVTGNTCSLAFIPSISFGASGSVFGFLFCLFSIQKYEEKYLHNKKLKALNNSLQKIILINVVINVLLAFSSSFLDWAGHLGGAIAGVLMSFAIVSNAKKKLKILQSSPFVIKSDEQLKFKLSENSKTYYFALLIVNILFFSAILNISQKEKAFSKGLKLATLTKTPLLSLDNLGQYSKMIFSQSSDASPEVLGKALSCMISLKNSQASYIIADVLKQYAKIETHFSYQPSSCDEPSKSSLSPKISKAGDFLNVLGFYQLSAKLYRAVYLLEPNNLIIIKKLAKTYLLSRDEAKLYELKKEIETQ